MIGERVDLSDVRPLASPAKDQAHVWYCRLGNLIGHIESLHSLLPPVEHDQAARFVSAEARDRFLVGRGVLRTLLGAYLRLPESAIALAIDPLGKPRLAASGDNPSLFFNLAHSGDWVLIGFATGGEIGVDIERHRPVAHWDGIAERHYSKRELAALRSVSGEEQRKLFFRIWTRKEAVLKWHGAGFQIPLTSVEAPLEDRCHAEVELPQMNERCWVQSIDAPAGYSAALAASHPVVEVVQREVDA